MIEFTQDQLDMLYRAVIKGRVGRHHISNEDLVKGSPSHKIGDYKDAIKELIRAGYLRGYKAQGRTDICIPTERYIEIRNILEDAGYELR